MIGTEGGGGAGAGAEFEVVDERNRCGSSSISDLSAASSVRQSGERATFLVADGGGRVNLVSTGGKEEEDAIIGGVFVYVRYISPGYRTI